MSDVFVAATSGGMMICAVLSAWPINHQNREKAIKAHMRVQAARFGVILFSGLFLLVSFAKG